MTALRAIRLKCLDCCCGSSNEVSLCPCQDCPLHSFRLGHNPNYQKKEMSEEQFKTVISSLRNIAPLDAVSPLISYLEELNGRTEKGSPAASEIMLAVINTLGAIGDKASFDSLLAVTYLNYEESVLTAAREALSGLRWQ